MLHHYGHQDNKQAYELLPTQAKLNVDSDSINTTNATLSINKSIKSYPVLSISKENIHPIEAMKMLESKHMLIKQKIGYARNITGRLRYFKKLTVTIIRKY